MGLLRAEEAALVADEMREDSAFEFCGWISRMLPEYTIRDQHVECS